ncbi:MAG: DCL family protein [Candidatus Zapsychrus exili]|nr:DCL family protein [Candidatus Zapsychrus exili]
MGKRQSITVNGVKFDTKSALRKYIRCILYKYPDRGILDDNDFCFMLSILDRHEDPSSKIGCGVQSMEVRVNPVFKNMGFWLIRVDESETDFSFEICLKHQTKLHKFKGACRSAIADDIISFKNDFFFNNNSPVCQLTGGAINKSNSHVDHSPPNTFNDIFNNFITEYGIDPDRVELLTSEDGRVRNEIADLSMRLKFVKFHNNMANLRCISAFANLSIVKRIRRC